MHVHTLALVDLSNIVQIVPLVWCYVSEQVLGSR